MGTRLFAFLVALGAAGCASSGDGLGRRGTDPLDVDWLQGSETITPAHLGRELELGAGNPEVSALVREAVTRLGGGQLAGLAACFTPCPASVTAEGGLTVVKSADVWVPRSLDELAFGGRSPEAAKILADVQQGRYRDVRVVERPDYFIVERTLMPQICIVPHLTVAAAYETIIHELVHAVRIDPRSGSIGAEAWRDEHAFLSGYVLATGGEVDAYILGTRARLRLQHRGIEISPLVVLFDPRSGEPRVPPATLAEVILGRRPYGLGYAEGLLRRTYAEGRAMAFTKLDEQRRLLEKMLDERRRYGAVAVANIEVHTHNRAAHEHNLGVAAARGDRALAERSRAGLAESQRGLARMQTMIEAGHASEGRLAEELAALARRREALGPQEGSP